MKKVLAAVLAFVVMAGLALPAAAAPNDIVGIEAVWKEEAVISLFTPVCYPSNTDVILKYESGETKLLTIWIGAGSYVLGDYYTVGWEITGRMADAVTVSVLFRAGPFSSDPTWTTEMAIPLVSLEQHVASHRPLTEIKENTTTRITKAQQVFMLKPGSNGRYHLPDQRECLPLFGANYQAAPVETVLDANNNAVPVFVNLQKGQTYYLVTTTDYIGREYPRSTQASASVSGPVRKLDFFGLAWSILTFGMFRQFWVLLPNGSKADIYALPAPAQGWAVSGWQLLQSNLSALAARSLFNRIGFFP